MTAVCRDQTAGLIVSSMQHLHLSMSELGLAHRASHSAAIFLGLWIQPAENVRRGYKTICAISFDE